MNSPRYARLAAKVFAQERGSLPPPMPSVEARSRAIAAVEQAMTARRRRRRVTEWTAGLVALAAVAAAALVVRREILYAHRPIAPVPATIGDAQIVAHPEGAGARMVLSGVQAPLPEGGALRSGSRIVTPANGGVSLVFSTGTSAVLGQWADMTLIGDGAAQVIRVDSGSVDLHVAKLGLGQRFLVDTPDAEVEVRGTRFRVSIVPADPTCGRGTWTRVAVTEGVVVVRHDGAVERVASGEEWPSDCGSTVTIGVRTLRGGRAVTPAAHVFSGRSSAESTLGAQNNLFAQAVAAKRRGDLAGAIDVLDRFLTKYPASPLSESVMVERMRLLRTSDRDRAAAAAALYLGRYPNGFAHAEAESMVAEAP